MMSIGESLRRFRKEQNVTQQEVAATLGMNYQNYGRYERNLSIPSVNVILKLADAYGVSTDYLLGRIDTPKLEPTKPEVDPQAEQFYTMFQTMLNTALNRATSG